MLAESAIVRRWLRQGVVLLAAGIAVVALLELQKLAARDRSPSVADLRRLLATLGFAAACVAALALSFAAANVVLRLRRDGVLAGAMAAGFGIAQLRRCFVRMVAVTVLATGGFAWLARGLLPPPPAVVQARNGGAFEWWPQAPAIGLAFRVDSLGVTPLAGGPEPPGSGWQASLLADLPYALLGGATVAAAGLLALLARTTRPLAVHAVLLHGIAGLGLACTFHPLLALAAAVGLVGVGDRWFARRGLRSGT